jgi:hypothetical protein
MLPVPAILGAKAVRKMRDKRPPKKRELKEHVLRRARELAESGRFEGWKGIEFELRFFEGFPKARIWLVGPVRRQLDILCRHARIRKSVSTSTKTAK